MNVTIGTQEVDMDPDDIPGFTFAIDDPLNPGRVTGTSSTVFKIPATNAGRVALGGPGMAEQPIQTDPDLDIGNGYVRAKIRPIEWDKNEIRAVAIGNNAGWISALKGIRINELDLGESPRIETSAILSSWFNEDALVYFPLIDYGSPWNGALDLETADFRPGFRCHALLKKAFQGLDYSVSVKGSLASVWKKFIIPCTEEIVIGQRYIDENKMELLQTDDTVTTVTALLYQDLPINVNVTTDPGGNVVSVRRYKLPLDMKFTAAFSMTVINTGGVGSLLNVYLHNYSTGQDISAPITVYTGNGEVINVTPFNLGEYELTANTEIGLRFRANSPTDLFTVAIQDFMFRVVPVNIEYQENITVDLDSIAPKMTAWELLMGIHYTRCLSFDTNDATKVVTIQYNDEKYRDIAQGRSLVGREDHTDPPVKGDPLRPERVVFTWKDDSEDLFLERANASAGARGYGGLIYPVDRGVLKEAKVEVPFAATAMRLYSGDVFIPVMREHDDFVDSPDNPGPSFKRKQRLLIADGTAFGEWEFNGAPMDIYPKCFFVRPGETDLTMSFSPETLYGSSGPGNVANHWGPFLYRMTKAKTLSIDLFIWDDECQTIDFGRPIEVHDGESSGWYYFTKIDRKRFGRHEPTRCELIQA